MSMNKLLTWKNVGIVFGVITLLVAVVFMGMNSQDKANGLSDVYITEDNVNVYAENKTDIITTLNKGDKVKMFNATPTYTVIQIKDTLGFVETKYVDLTTATNISEEHKIYVWSSMEEMGLTTGVPTYDGAQKVNSEDDANTLLYNWHIKVMNKLLGKDSKPLQTTPKEPVKPVEPTKPVKPVEPVKPTEPTKPTEPVKPVVPTKPVENNSKYTDTVKYVNLSAEYEDNENPFNITVKSYTVINDGVKGYESPSTSSKVNLTYNAGDELKRSPLNFDYLKKHYASSKTPAEWVAVQEANNTGWTYSYVKRSDLVTNYIVYVSPKAKDWKYDHLSANISSASMFKGLPSAPMFDSADYVTNTVSVHDPIYNTLAAGTSITPTGVSNSSIKKPKAGAGASTNEYIPSTGTAAGDGWVAPTLNKKYKDDRFEFAIDFEQIGMFWNPTQHMGSIFLTGDGSRLDVMAVNQEETKARFVLTNVNTKESYRSKEMLKVVLPYFFKNNTTAEINQVHADFMSYISSGKTTDVTKNYKGFKAVFMKTESNKYRLDIR